MFLLRLRRKALCYKLSLSSVSRLCHRDLNHKAFRNTQPFSIKTKGSKFFGLQSSRIAFTSPTFAKATSFTSFKIRPSCFQTSVTQRLGFFLLLSSTPTRSYRSSPSVAEVCPKFDNQNIFQRRHLAICAAPSQEETSKITMTPEDPKVTVITEALEKPLLDDRSYRVIQLGNKVEALLVHDAETDKSSAALDVRVGSMCDDAELQGQAHAVEHVLFLGTKKYPGENDYMQYLANHSGASNAFTSSLSTNYYFEVSHKNFYEALDRFSQFFIAPLFDPNGLDRELNAVDSEHKKNIQQDLYRDYQVSKVTANPNHPFSRFNTGNLQTLRDEPGKQGIDVRDRFMKFHERYYSGNLMKLTILGRESLDQLQEWAIELFSDIKNKDLPIPTFEGLPLTKDELLQQHFIKPVMETRSLTYTFPFLDEDPLWETHPSRYIGHLIGHEGPGSILAVLRDVGWATSLSAGAQRICPGAGKFVVSIRLSEAGIQKVPEITALLFKYLHIINSESPQEWVVKELQNMAEVEFRYKQKSSHAGTFASSMAGTMQHDLPREYLLSNHKIRRFSAKDISDGLEYLRPDNFRLLINTPNLPEGLSWDKKEHFYGVEYTTQNLPDSMLKLARNAFEGKSFAGFESAKAELHMPHPNPFIPTNFDVHKKDNPTIQKVPALIRNTPECRIWFKKDDTFWAPKANVFFTIRTPIVYSTPRDYAIARMFCELVKDSLHEYSYDAEIAGLYYHLSANMLGFDLEIGGYNDKMSVLLTKVVQAMQDLEVKEGRWDVLKERLMRAYRNWELGVPYQMVPEFMRWVVSEKKWLNEEVLAELERLDSVDVVRAWWQDITKMHIEGLVHGNLYKEDALNMTKSITKILEPKTLPLSEYFTRRCVLIPEGSNLIYERDQRDLKNVNNAIEYMIHLGSNENRTLRAKLSLWAQITQERAFDTLRTKEQLGYVVLSGQLVQATTMGYRVLIQSERSCEYLESRIEAFLSGDWDLTDEAFEKHQQSLLTKLSESLKNLNQESNRLWWYVGSEQYDFLQLDFAIDEVSKLTKEDMKEFYDYYISPNSSTRAKLSIHFKSVAKEANESSITSAFDHVLKALTQFLGSVLPAPPTEDEMRTNFLDVDVHSVDGIAAQVKTFLTSRGLEESKVDDIVQQGKQAMESLMPQIEAMESDRATTGEDKKKLVTYITDINAWRRGMLLSKGPRPVRDFSEMEETGVKL